MFPFNLALGQGWYTWSTVVLAVVALFYIVLVVFLPLGAGLMTGSGALVVFGFIGFFTWFLFSGVLYYTSNECRKQWKPDWVPKPTAAASS